MKRHISSLSFCILGLVPIASHSSGLDRSTQPSWGFTQDGTFAYIEHITIDPKIHGKDTSSNNIPDMADSYQFFNYGVKSDINDNMSIGVFFDQPWGADVNYTGTNDFIAPANKTIAGLFKQANVENVTDVNSASTYIKNANEQLNALQPSINAVRAALPTLPSGSAQAPKIQETLKTYDDKVAKLNQLKGLTATATKVANDQQATNATVSSQNITGILGLKLGKDKQFHIYGGPVMEKLKGEIHLRGDAYSLATGYDAKISNDTAYGWLIGAAYSKPSIGLKAALTYRSEIDHKMPISESLSLAPLLGVAAEQQHENTISMPKSVNLDFQTGLNPTTLLLAKVRWVPWSEFGVTPHAFHELTKSAKDSAGNKLYPNGLPLVSYDKDSWTAELGLAKKLSDKLALSTSVGWDSGLGSPTSTLGPIEGNWNIGLGAKYSLTPEWSISSGVKYVKFGDALAKSTTGAIVGDFKDNDAWVYGIRLSYQKK